ncbi:protein FAM124A-like isoform X1 [Hemitrygon akajei]|uniref:protein FAM124A-like isoform X1 n=2 Tax=Hemitrygon akajei TaxID=2704970 RepID=UPI003BF9FF1F
MERGTGEQKSEGRLYLEDMLDPFLVTVHIITDPGGAAALQSAVDSLVTWINPGLQLFVASERGSSLPPRGGTGTDQPALAVIVFVHEERGEQVWRLHECFLSPPWKYHHTERIKDRTLPCMPSNQDFFTLADHPILWATRQVHYEKEVVRLSLYCSFDNFADTVRMYQLILRRKVSKCRTDATLFTVYSSSDVEIQLSLKRLPKGRCPVSRQSAVLEFRVDDIGSLVPLLPNPCCPISERRWQTEDYDGNKLLLQVQDLSGNLWRGQGVPPLTRVKSGRFAPSCTLLSQCVGCAPERCSQRQPINCRPRLARGLGRFQGKSQEDLWGGDHGDNRQSRSTSGYPRAARRSKSLFCLPTFTGSVSPSSFLPLGERHQPTGVDSAVAALDVNSAAEMGVDTRLATMGSRSHGLKAAHPPLQKTSRNPASDAFSCFSLASKPLPPFCRRPSSSSPHLQDFPPSVLSPRTPSPWAPIVTSWLCHKAKQPSSPVANSAAENKGCLQNQLSALSLDAEQEFYI